jgi:hypothetical protein
MTPQTDEARGRDDETQVPRLSTVFLVQAPPGRRLSREAKNRKLTIARARTSIDPANRSITARSASCS